MVIKRAKTHVKQMWSDRDREASTSWRIFGIAMAIIIGAAVLFAGVGLFLPALGVMCSAWFLHHVWDQIPAISYVQSMVGIVGLWVVGWTIGFLLRLFVFALTGGGK